MAKKKSIFKNVPSKYVALGIASLLLNVVLIGVMVVGNVLERSGTFDYATVNSGITKMCSDAFRQTVEKTSKQRGESDDAVKKTLAGLDYPCLNKGSQPYYEDGMNKYLKSLGLNP